MCEFFITNFKTSRDEFSIYGYKDFTHKVLRAVKL